MSSNITNQTSGKKGIGIVQNQRFDSLMTIVNFVRIEFYCAMMHNQDKESLCVQVMLFPQDYRITYCLDDSKIRLSLPKPFRIVLKLWKVVENI